MKRTPLGRVGEIAHEMSHCVLAHQNVKSHKRGGGPEAEAEADALAKSWGFDAEIDGIDVDMKKEYNFRIILKLFRRVGLLGRLRR